MGKVIDMKVAKMKYMAEFVVNHFNSDPADITFFAGSLIAATLNDVDPSLRGDAFVRVTDMIADLAKIGEDDEG